jgi:hypothetical protein
VGEVQRPVDRVDDPAPAAAPGRVAALLAEDAVVGPLLGQNGNGGRLGGAVGDGDDVGRLG